MTIRPVARPLANAPSQVVPTPTPPTAAAVVAPAVPEKVNGEVESKIDSRYPSYSDNNKRTTWLLILIPALNPASSHLLI